MKHYKGYFGTCDYDERMFDILVEHVGNTVIDYLHYRTDCPKELPLELPAGYNSCFGLFKDSYIPENFRFSKRFDTSKVTNMDLMFAGSTLPFNFNINIDTTSVTSMRYMFRHCALPYGFSLGNRFSTKAVVDMEGMFQDCVFNQAFTLGAKFDTSNVRNMAYMFDGCIMNDDFNLGSQFDTTNVITMLNMFSDAMLNDSFNLGNCFYTTNLQAASHMFRNVRLPHNFYLPNTFKLDNCSNAPVFTDASICDKKFGSSMSTVAIVNLLQHRGDCCGWKLEVTAANDSHLKLTTSCGISRRYYSRNSKLRDYNICMYCGKHIVLNEIVD